MYISYIRVKDFLKRKFNKKKYYIISAKKLNSYCTSMDTNELLELKKLNVLEI